MMGFVKYSLSLSDRESFTVCEILKKSQKLSFRKNEANVNIFLIGTYLGLLQKG